MLRTDALDYHLPPDRIAQRPMEPRDAARLLVIRRDRPDQPEDLQVRDLPQVLAAGDRLVVNTTRVLAARFRGVREDTGGRVEGLYLGQPETEPLPGPGVWLALLKSRRHRPGAPVRLLSGGSDRASPYVLTMLRPLEEPPGAWVIEVSAEDRSLPLDAPAVLAAVGLPPLPPYIRTARRASGAADESPDDPERYQTVYAGEPQGAGGGCSVAAPTAGLHFTPGLLDRLAAAGIARTDVLLHVGAGTFKPVETEFVEEHPIHAEWCSMSDRAVGEVAATRAAGGRVVAVGTTSVRTLEAYAEAGEAGDRPANLQTRLLITPGRRFRWTDALLTNFHLPRSTLMALVAAALQGPDEPPDADGTPPGVGRLLAAYTHAMERGYRFYSYGDAMLIL